MDEGLCLDIRSLRKRFGAHLAVDNVDLSIRKGEFFALLGSSGCGKTTLLRMVAGFETPDSGEIRLQGRDVARVPPNERPVNMVFQNYALFPHLTVRDNVAFGLRMKRLPEGEVASRVEEALSSVQLSELSGRKPHQLSGGQQQRVALARALVNRPEILLLDEPMAALDEKLRKDMRVELKALQHRVGVSFLYVTHDQEEALSLADRIAVMEKGRIAQVGTPQEIYESPASTFVADFVGHSNLWGGKVVEVEALLTDQEPSVRRPGGPHEPPGRREGESPRRRAFVEVPEVGRVAVCVTNGFVPGSEVVLALRPERIHLSTSPVENLDNRLPGKVERILFLGSDVHYQVRLSNGRKLMAHTVYSPLRRVRKEGDRVYLQWRAEDVNVLHP